MTDEIRPEGQSTETPPTQPEAAAAEATAVAGTEEQDREKAKLHQEVEIKDVGPCKKHIRVSVSREDIDARFGEHFSKLVKESVVRGFRPGKAPRRIIEKQFQREVGDQVKNEVLMASLQQLSEDYEIAPLSEPNLQLEQIEIPREGPLVYEFEVEVRPEFDLPNYRGMKLRRPVKDFTEADIAQARRRLLADQGQVVPKEDGSADIGDIIVADITFRDGDRVINTVQEGRYEVERQLSFKDALAPRFGEQIKGARAGDTRVVEFRMAGNAGGGMAGKTILASFDVKDVKTLRLPELTPEYLQQRFGLHSRDELDEVILVALKRELEHVQRRSAREQIINQISATANLELPEDLLKRQARKALNRRIMEMKSDGIPDAEINRHRRLLEQNILETTALSLREHFVLQKIAEAEKITVDEDDLNDEIERIANQTNESPRRVRARLEKDEMLDALAAEMIERRALDLVLDSAEYEDVAIDQEQTAPAVSTVEEQAMPGPMQELPSDASPPQEGGAQG